MLKLISELVELGLKIPEDIGVAGFDDTEWYKLIGPGITTVAQPSHEMGKAAHAKIKTRLKGMKVRPKTIQLDGEIIVRKIFINNKQRRVYICACSLFFN
ncbi:substrate-binding domain-containing protein [Bacillus sp. SL00103]